MHTPATATPEASFDLLPGSPAAVDRERAANDHAHEHRRHAAGARRPRRSAIPRPRSRATTPKTFSIGSSSCNGAIVFEQSCQLTVRFAPQAPGTSTATLQIDGNMGAGSTTIALSGSGGSLPQGPSGADDKGAQGPAGPQGERGPTGPAAVYECHPREGHGKFATACFVHVAAGSPSVLKATLRRGGAVYATGPVTSTGAEHGKGLTLRATRVVPAGRYRLVLVSRGGASTSRYVTVK